MIPRIRRIQEETSKGLKILKDADTIRCQGTVADGNPRGFGTWIFPCLKNAVKWSQGYLAKTLFLQVFVVTWVASTSCQLLMLLSTEPGNTMWEVAGGIASTSLDSTPSLWLPHSCEHHRSKSGLGPRSRAWGVEFKVLGISGTQTQMSSEFYTVVSRGRIHPLSYL